LTPVEIMAATGRNSGLARLAGELVVPSAAPLAGAESPPAVASYICRRRRQLRQAFRTHMVVARAWRTRGGSIAALLSWLISSGAWRRSVPAILPQSMLIAACHDPWIDLRQYKS